MANLCPIETEILLNAQSLFWKNTSDITYI
jgi:hypothetical protein